LVALSNIDQRKGGEERGKRRGRGEGEAEGEGGRGREEGRGERGGEGEEMDASFRLLVLFLKL
jgi:hypothetical protein